MNKWELELDKRYADFKKDCRKMEQYSHLINDIREKCFIVSRDENGKHTIR